MEGLSQDLETGCLKFAIVKKFWASKGGLQYTQISTINMYEFIRIRHNILIKCHGNYMEMKKFNYLIVIDILRNSHKKIVCLERCFLRVWVSKECPDTLLAKTMLE